MKSIRLTEVSDIIMGQSPPGNTYNNEGLGLPFYQGVRDFTTRFPSKRVYCTTPTRIAETNDILLSVRAPIGRINIAKERCAIGRGLSIIRVKNQTDFRFIENCLKSLKSEWDSFEGSGSVFGNAKKEDLENLQIPWIKNRGDRCFVGDFLGGFEDKIELNRRMNATLEAMAAALFKHWFVDNPEAKGWEIKTIGEVVTVVGGSTPSTHNPPFWENGYIHWATPKDLSPLQSPILLDTERKITKLGLQQISSGLLPVGVVLLSSRAPIGYLAIAQMPISINQGFIAMKCTEEMPNFFILHWVKENMEDIVGRANGTTFLEISKSNFRPMPIVIPPCDVMKIFIEQVEPMYKKVVANLKESQTLASLRDSLLPRLMRGEVRVRTS